MKTYGLLGYPLGHSFSKGYFAGRLEYENYPYENVEDFLALKPAELAGFNVTIPHKQNVLPFLSEVSAEASEIGAVNCVRVEADGRLVGYNTDCYGFEHSLLDMIREERPRALVLGDGGASKAVVYVLRKLGIEYKLVSRRSELNYATLTAEMVREHKLIINTTPLGMYPKVETAPEISYCELTKNHYLYDLVYNPAETRFMREGRMRGAVVINGLRMLQLQAERSFDIWTGRE